jgi:hypothetical protein
MGRRIKSGNYLIVGIDNILKALGIKSNKTFYRWVLKHEFPASKLPNGQWSTTQGLIDVWIIARKRTQEKT